MNSLSAIAGHEGEEDEWERDLRSLRDDDEVRLISPGVRSMCVLTR